MIIKINILASKFSSANCECNHMSFSANRRGVVISVCLVSEVFHLIQAPKY